MDKNVNSLTLRSIFSLSSGAINETDDSSSMWKTQADGEAGLLIEFVKFEKCNGEFPEDEAKPSWRGWAVRFKWEAAKHAKRKPPLTIKKGTRS